MSAAGGRSHGRQGPRAQERKIFLCRLRHRETLLDALYPGMNDCREGKMRVGGCIGRTEFEVELGGAGDVADVGNRADAHRCLAVAKTEIVEGCAPAMRRETQVGDHARRRDRNDRVEIFQNAGDELSRNIGKLMFAVRIVGDRVTRRIQHAHVDMHAVADPGRIADRREGRLIGKLAGDETDKFAGNQRMIGDGDAPLGPIVTSN